MMSRNRFEANFDSLRQSRVTRGIDEAPTAEVRHVSDVTAPWADLINRPVSFSNAPLSDSELIRATEPSQGHPGVTSFGIHSEVWNQDRLAGETRVGTGMVYDEFSIGLSSNTLSSWSISGENGIIFSKRFNAKEKPTIVEVERRLGVPACNWDVVAPEDLIEAIYELCKS